jgi:regulator of sigma E protease
MQEIFTHNIPAFIFVLGVIIFVHESGHLLVAKAFGMRVFIFSFGFGKRLFGFQWGDTDCRVSLIPLGGYVKLEGEPEDHLSEDTSAPLVGDGRDFLSRPRWQRLLVYLAGPAMNGVLTLSVLTVLFYTIGWAVDSTRFEKPILGAIDPGSPADTAGLKTGDEIVSIDGEALPNWESVQYHVVLRPDRDLGVVVRRDGVPVETKVRSASTEEDKIGTIGVHPLVRIGELVKGSPAQEAGLQVDDAILRIDDKPVREFAEIPDLVKGAAGRTLRVAIWRAGELLDVAVAPRDSGEGPRIGIGGKTVHKRFGAVGSFVEASRFSWQNTKLTFDVLKRLVTAQISPKTMMGPVGIAKASGERAREGWASLFFLIAVISLQVGILNLFPLAPLDGGHMAILVGEGLFRRDFSMTVKTWVMNAGLVVVLLLVVVSSYSDLSKLKFLGKFLP